MIKLHKGLDTSTVCLITPPEPTKYMHRPLNVTKSSNRIGAYALFVWTYLTIDFHVARAKTKENKVVSEVRVLHCS